MHELTIFENPAFGQMRAVSIDGEPWFVAADVCKALDIANTTQAVARLDEDERSMFNIGRQGDTNCVNEYGLYNLVLASRKPEAKQFKRWVTHEVIPSIRKHGAYINGQETMSDTELLERAVLAAQRMIEERDKRIAAMRPKELFADAVSASKTSILVGDLAKLLCQNGVDIGQRRLFDWLRRNGYLIKQQGASWNMPTQRSMEMGLFEIKESAHTSPDGTILITRTPYVTGKGQRYFIDKFLKAKQKEADDAEN